LLKPFWLEPVCLKAHLCKCVVCRDLRPAARPSLAQMAGEEEEWEMHTMDLETLIASYGIDDSAAQALRSCSEDALGRIMAKGPLTGDNPSALIMSRIRDEADGAAEDPEAFIAMLDDQAKKVWHQQPEGVKQLIMEEGALLGYNPSAILMGRLRKAKDKFKASGGAAAAVRAPQPGVKVVVKPKKGSARKAAAGAAEDGSGLTGSAALHCLGVQLGQWNSACWDFDVPRADLMASVKAILDTRDAAAAAAYEQWPAADEPQRKRARQAPAGGDRAGQDLLTDAEKEQQRDALLSEVIRMLGDNGGEMLLQDIGSKHLTDLRTGAIGSKTSLSKFLATRPDVVRITSPADGSSASPTVTLL